MGRGREARARKALRGACYVGEGSLGQEGSGGRLLCGGGELGSGRLLGSVDHHWLICLPTQGMMAQDSAKKC